MPPNPAAGRPRRTGLETAHLCLVLLSLATVILQEVLGVITVASLAFSTGSNILLFVVTSVLLNPVLWLLVAALVQSARRRPSCTSAAVCAAMLLGIARTLLLLMVVPTIPTVPHLIVAVPILVAAGIGLSSDRRVHTRPVGVSLALGTALGFLPLLVSSLVNAVFASSPAGDDRLTSLGPLLSSSPLIHMDVPVIVPLGMAAVAALAAAVALSAMQRPRGEGERAWRRLRLGTSSPPDWW